MVLVCYKVTSVKQSLAGLFSMRNVTAWPQDPSDQPCECTVPPVYIYAITTLFLIYIGWKCLQFVINLCRTGTSSYKTLMAYNQSTAGGQKSDVLLEIGKVLNTLSSNYWEDPQDNITWLAHWQENPTPNPALLKWEDVGLNTWLSIGRPIHCIMWTLVWQKNQSQLLKFPYLKETALAILWEDQKWLKY